MSYSKLLKLGLIAAIMFTLAFWVSSPESSQTKNVAVNTTLVQGIDTQAITAIEVSDANRNVRLVKKETGFVVETRYNYPALYEEVNNLLVNCMDIRVSEFITANPENYVDLQVTPSTAYRQVRLFGAEGKLITGFIIGKVGGADGRRYVRLVNNDENAATSVYLTNEMDLESTWMFTKPVSYVMNRLLQCEESDIAGIKVVGPDGSYEMAVKADEAGTATPELLNVPEGKEADDVGLKRVLEAATDIKFDDLQPASQVDENLKFEYRYIVNTVDDTELTLRLAKTSVDGKENYLVKCSSRYTNKEFLDNVKSGNMTVGKEQEAMEAADKQILAYQASMDFNARHKDWVYVMEPVTGEKFTKKLSEMIKDKPVAQPVAAPAN